MFGTRVFARLVLLACAALAAACGGGGGAAAPAPIAPDPPAPADEPAVLTGEIELFIPEQETVLEVEPNDEQLQAHYLGEMRPGREVDLIGRAGTGDPDGFRLLADPRVEIDATLEYQGAATARLGLGVWDFLGQRYVELHEPDGSPVTVTLPLKGVAALVVYAAEGEADYVLRLRTRSAPAQHDEREPNGDFYAGQYLGELDRLDSVTVRGEGSAFSDEWDSVQFSCPSAIELEAIASIPPTGLPEETEYDIHVYDLTGGESEPPLLARFTWGSDGVDFARGRVEVAAGSLVQVFVRAVGGEARWVLALRAWEPATGAAFQPAVARAGGTPEAGAPRALPPDFGRLPDSIVPGRAAVRAATTAPGAAARAAASRGCACEGGDGTRPVAVRVPLPRGMDDARARRATVRAVHALARSAELAWAEPVFLRRPMREPDDEFYALQQWHYDLMGLEQAWDLTTGDDAVVVAVLDTGSSAHPDLAGRWVAGYDFVSDPDNALDGDGRDGDPTDPGDLAYGSASSFHGTHVAGTIAARTDNGTGVAGVTWRGAVMPLRVLGRFGGTTVDIAEAVRFAAGLPNASGTVPAQRAHVINMSLGGPGFSRTMADAVAAARQAGVVVFASSGNGGDTVANYPAAYDGVVSVGAVGPTTGRAYYSSYGATLDLVAPGGDMRYDRDADGYVDGVLSTIVLDGESPPRLWYSFSQGTSMACPHAAGVAALLFAVAPDLTPDDVETILADTAEDLGDPGRDDEYGAGMINAVAAVQAARAAVEPPAPPELDLSSTAIVFEPGDETARVRIRNLGGGRLEVDPPAVVTQSGLPWLEATRVPSASGTTDTSAIDLRVVRDGLEDAVHFGRVQVATNGGQADIQVLLRVQLVPPGPPDVDVFVRLVDAATGEVAQQVTVNPTGSLAFTLEDVAPGRYRLEAGTDPNGNGRLFETGELGGVYPVESAPILLDIRAGEERGPFRFTVKPSGILDE